VKLSPQEIAEALDEDFQIQIEVNTHPADVDPGYEDAYADWREPELEEKALLEAEDDLASQDDFESYRCWDPTADWPY
jgi:hypothetical protein